MRGIDGMRLHHLGIASADPERTAAFVRQAWDIVSETGPVHDPLQNADLCMLTTSQGAAIEIVSGPAVAAFVKRATALYHSCFEVDDITSAVERLKAAGALALSDPKPAVLFDGRPVCFLQTPIGLLELLQAPGGASP